MHQLTRVHRIWNLRPWRASPLMGFAHRLEVMLALVCVVVVLGSIPVGAAVGTTVYTDHSAAARAAAATEQHVPAVVVELGQPIVTADVVQAQARVSWVAGGRTQTAMVPLDHVPNLGERVRIWVGRDGNPAGAPPTAADVWCAAIGTACTLIMLAIVGASALYYMVSRSLRRRSYAAWGREWAELAHVPRWN